MSPVKIFYSYAHEDEECKKELSAYLGILRQNNKIIEWDDRKILPGVDFNKEIKDKLESSNVVICLISKDFLNSDYCFGIEVEKAFMLQKQNKIEIIPILLKPCLFDESRFSQLQIIPFDAQPIYTSPSKEIVFNDVAKTIRDIVYNISQRKTTQQYIGEDGKQYPPSVDIVRKQVTAYAQLYERIRQLMTPSNERTVKMQIIFDQMKIIATSSYLFLEEFSKSPLPGERLAAISILQQFSSEDYFAFLIDIISKDKPFVAYQAILALSFAVRAVPNQSYNSLLNCIALAKEKLVNALVSKYSDRYKELEHAENELKFKIQSDSILKR